MTKKVFPKYHELVCDTYTPNFAASGEICVLQTTKEVTKARKEAGGTFFRSVKDGGSGNVNNITLECLVTAGSPPGTDNVVFKITDIDAIEVVDRTVYTIEFTQDSGSPCSIGDDGIKKLRGILNAGSPNYPYPVIMPEVDNEQPWDAATQDAHCTIAEFTPAVSMGGAKVLPDGSVSIRTGPAFTLFHIQTAETGTKGEITDVNALSEWDGVQWIAYPSELYAAGSGSPALCDV